MTACVWRQVIGGVCGLALLLVNLQGQTYVRAELRNQLKKSTAYIRTSNDDSNGTGTGFVVQSERNVAYIATNNHVIDAEREGQEVNASRTRLRVSFGSGDSEKPLRAELLAADKAHDLAILKVVMDNPPPAFELNSKRILEETLGFTVFGFPLGDPNITVNTGQVSGFRNSPAGTMSRVKMFAKVDPGNSGGPVVDGDGALIGVTVEKDRRADSIGYAIPAFELHELMSGRLEEFKVRQEGGPGTYDFKFSAKVLDPMLRLQKATIYYASEEDISDEQVKAALSEDNTRWSLLSSSMIAVPITGLRNGDIVKQTFPVTGKPGKACYVQVKYERQGAKTSLSEPLRIIIGGGPDPRAKEGKDGDGESKKKGDDDGGIYPLPREKKESLLGPKVATSGYRTSEWLVPGDNVIPNIAWDEDALYVYIVERNGVIRKVDPFRNQVELQQELKIVCRWAALSGEGLLLLTADETPDLWVIDERSLKVREVINDLLGATRVASATNNFYGFCVTDDGQGITVYDLIDGEKTQHYLAADFRLPPNSGVGAKVVNHFNHLTMTPDGRFLVCESEGALHRFRVKDDEISYEQASAPLATKPEGVFVSSDGQYVSLPDREGNSKVGELGIESFGIYSFQIEDFATPDFVINGGQPTPLVVREDVGRNVFGTVKNSPLVVFGPEGQKQREFPELQGTFAMQILAYPRRTGFLLVLTEEKLYVVKR